MAPHFVTIDHLPADAIDTEAFAAFCEDCPWRGEWHHDDGEGPAEAELRAEDDADDHRVDTSNTTS